MKFLHWHRWKKMKWGGKSMLDCRECKCGAFEIWSFGAYRRVDRARFPDVVEVPS